MCSFATSSNSRYLICTSKAKNRIPWNDFIFKQKPKEITLLGHLCPLSLIVVVGTCMVYFYYHRGVYLFFLEKNNTMSTNKWRYKTKNFLQVNVLFFPQKTILTFICCMCEITRNSALNLISIKVHTSSSS